jgi:hypothetical protein
VVCQVWLQLREDKEAQGRCMESMEFIGGLFYSMGRSCDHSCHLIWGSALHRAYIISCPVPLKCGIKLLSVAEQC